MTDRTIELDSHRGMAAQKATELRRLLTEVAADRARLKERQDELEKALLAEPASSWADAVEKARYLLSLFAATAEAGTRAADADRTPARGFRAAARGRTRRRRGACEDADDRRTGRTSPSLSRSTNMARLR